MDHVFGKIPSIKGSQQQRQITQMQKQTHLARDLVPETEESVLDTKLPAILSNKEIVRVSV